MIIYEKNLSVQPKFPQDYKQNSLSPDKLKSLALHSLFKSNSKLDNSLPFTKLSPSLIRKVVSSAFPYPHQESLKSEYIDLAIKKANSATSEAQFAAVKSSPVNNMGGIDANTYTIVSAGSNGQAKMVKIPNKNPKTDPSAAFIDWLNFTFKVESFNSEFSTLSSVSDELFIAGLSEKLTECLGYGISLKSSGGKNYYSESYELGDGWGHVCVGGRRQNGSCLVMIGGQGCMAAKDGWYRNIQEFIFKVKGKITRVDLSADYFEGEYTVDRAAGDYLAGLYSNGGQSKVYINQQGNWLKPDGQGRSFYVGKFTNGKQLCVYEKGLQLGGTFADSFKDWVRVELRLGSKDRIIPLDVLAYPGQYLSAGYPALNFISKVQSKIKTEKAKIQVEYEKAKAVIKHQFGKYLYAIAGVEGSIKDLIVEGIPKRLSAPSFEYRITTDIKLDDYRVSEDYALSIAFC